MLGRSVTLLDDILAWSVGRPAWQRDALRRLVLSGRLSDHDIAELALMAEAAHNDSVGGPSPRPLTADHLPIRPPGASPVALRAIREVQHINAWRLANTCR